MAYNTGTRSLVTEMAVWTAVGGLALALFVNYESLKRIAVGQFKTGEAVSASPIKAAAVTPADSSGSVQLRAGERGHYHTRADVNGRTIETMVDTGASIVVLTYEDARAAGIHLKPSDFVQTASTANGTAKFAPVTLERISIGNIIVRNVPAAVADQGRLAVTLLGMSFLSRLGRVDMRDGVMILKN